MSYVGLNAHTEDPTFPVPDCSSVLDALLSAEVFCCLDIKAGFNNIPVSPESIPLTGIVTQDGCFEALRMQFGLKSAPSHF